MQKLAASTLITSVFALGLLIANPLLASGVASAPSEAASETSSKQSSEGSSNSSSGSSPERRFVQNNIQQIQIDTARQGGATVDALAQIYQLPSAEVRQRLQQLMAHQADNQKALSQKELSLQIVSALQANQS